MFGTDMNFLLLAPATSAENHHGSFSANGSSTTSIARSPNASYSDPNTNALYQSTLEGVIMYMQRNQMWQSISYLVSTCIALHEVAAAADESAEPVQQDRKERSSGMCGSGNRSTAAVCNTANAIIRVITAAAMDGFMICYQCNGSQYALYALTLILHAGSITSTFGALSNVKCVVEARNAVSATTSAISEACTSTMHKYTDQPFKERRVKRAPSAAFNVPSAAASDSCAPSCSAAAAACSCADNTTDQQHAIEGTYQDKAQEVLDTESAAVEGHQQRAVAWLPRAPALLLTLRMALVLFVPIHIIYAPHDNLNFMADGHAAVEAACASCLMLAWLALVAACSAANFGVALAAWRGRNSMAATSLLRNCHVALCWVELPVIAAIFSCYGRRSRHQALAAAAAAVHGVSLAMNQLIWKYFMHK